MKYLYCQPLFEERKCAHRFSYQLAETFKRRSLKLCLFDYQGTGEAAGNFCEITLNSLCDDINQQIKNTPIGLIALRLGATLALHCACQNQNKVDSLILIEPVINTTSYINHLQRKQHIKDIITNTPASLHCNCNYINIEGYKTRKKLIQQIKNISPENLTTSGLVKNKISIIQISRNKKIKTEFLDFADQLKKSNNNVTITPIKLPQFWERIPTIDYSLLTEKILEITRD